jgi:GDP-L-fucose synthase
MNKEDKIYVAGHRGMVGSAITRKLQAKGFTNIVDRTYGELDLKVQREVEVFSKQKSQTMSSLRQLK